MSKHLLTITLAIVLCHCGDDSTPPIGAPDPARELTQPVLRLVAPSAIRAGEELTILGEGFVDNTMGETRLSFEGVYQTTSGATQQVKLEAIPAYKNQGTLSWTFGPNIPFSNEEDTGNFRGVLKATNVGLDGTIKEAPQAIGVDLQVLPSIIIRQIRPMGTGCPVSMSETTDQTALLLEVKAIGLRNGTETAPLRYIYTFMKENFQFSGYLSNQMGVDPESLFPATGPVSVIDDVENGNTSALGAGAPRNVYVYKGAESNSLASMVAGMENLFSLTELTTAPVPAVASSYEATINILAIDSSGQQTKRSIPLTVWSPVEVRYNGDFETVKSFDPVPVSGCIAGGDIGRDVTYSEMTTETRSRRFATSNKVSLEGNIFIARLNAEFGIDVEATVTSAKAENLQITGKILPREFAVFYRQTLQLERKAKLIGHSACGTSQPLGEVIVTDWVWSPDLAKGMSCPPLPPSNLPPGQEY